MWRCAGPCHPNATKHEDDNGSSGSFSFSVPVKHMDHRHCAPKQRTSTETASRTNGEKLINVNGLSFMSWTGTGCRTIGCYWTSQNGTASNRSNEVDCRHFDQIERSLSCPLSASYYQQQQELWHADVSLSASSPHELLLVSKTRDRHPKENDRKVATRTTAVVVSSRNELALNVGNERRGGAVGQLAIRTKDQSQLNENGQYLCYDTDDWWWRWCYRGPEQDQLSNIQCRRKPLAYKSGQSMEIQRRTRMESGAHRVDDSIPALFSSTSTFSAVAFLTPSAHCRARLCLLWATLLVIAFGRRIGTTGSQLTDSAIGQLLVGSSLFVTSWLLYPVADYAQNSIEFTLTKPHQHIRNCFCYLSGRGATATGGGGEGTRCKWQQLDKDDDYRIIRAFSFLWSTVIVIVLQNVITITVNVFPVAWAAWTAVTAFRLVTNYRHCASAELCTGIDGRWTMMKSGGSIERRRTPNVLNERAELEKNGEFQLEYQKKWTASVIRGRLGQSNGGNNPPVKYIISASETTWAMRQFAGTSTVLHFVLNKLLGAFKESVWRRRRRRRKLSGEDSDQVRKVIVAKMKRKLLNCPDFYRITGTVRRNSASIVDKMFPSPSPSHSQLLYSTAATSCSRIHGAGPGGCKWNRRRQCQQNGMCGIGKCRRTNRSTLCWPSPRRTRTGGGGNGALANRGDAIEWRRRRRIQSIEAFQANRIDLACVEIESFNQELKCVPHGGCDNYHDDPPRLEKLDRALWPGTSFLRCSCRLGVWRGRKWRKNSRIFNDGYNSFELLSSWLLLCAGDEAFLVELYCRSYDKAGDEDEKSRRGASRGKARALEGAIICLCDEEHLSKDNLTVICVHLLIAIMLMARWRTWRSDKVKRSHCKRRKPSIETVTNHHYYNYHFTSRPEGLTEAVAKAQLAVTPTTTTIRIIIHDHEQHHTNNLVSGTNNRDAGGCWCCCSARLPLGLYLDIFPAISPFPFQTTTTFGSLDFVKWSSLAWCCCPPIVLLISKAGAGAGAGRRGRRMSDGAAGKITAVEVVKAASSSSMSNETESNGHGDIKLQHYNVQRAGPAAAGGTLVDGMTGGAATNKRRHLVLLLFLVITSVVNLPSVSCLSVSSAGSGGGGGGPGSFKYSTNVVKTKYGPLRGIVLRSHPVVEAYLGVPYATPPVGSLRYMPPMTPSSWKTIRLADRFAPVCPQRVPMPAEGDAALLDVPRERLAQLRRFRPLLTNQSEDCLYLNLYVPRADSSRDAGAEPNPEENPLKAAMVYIHGESYEWNSGNLYDGTMLAAHGDVIVVTINFRLGILGFLKTGTKESAQGNFGLMDLVAGLHWLRENLPAFNGDGNKITVMGHGSGAALANILVVSPVASDLITRVILLSGSALSPWAIQKEPLIIKRRVAEHTGCHGDLLEDDLAPCLRNKSVKELLSVSVDSPRFLPGFAPFIDGTVIVNPINIGPIPLTLPLGAAIVSTNGIEFANYPTKEILFGLTALESYLDLSAQDLEFGFNETRRDRILRTFVRNVFHFHLNEIYSTLKNEYTDWERPARSQIASRDATMELLSDGHTAAPLIRMAYLHSVRGGRSYFLHFRHQTSERDFPQRFGSVRGEDVPFCLGLPLSPLFPYNYTKQDYKISIILVRYFSNFAKSGNPNGHSYSSQSLSSLSSAAVASALTADNDSDGSSATMDADLERREDAAAGDRIAKEHLINSGDGSTFDINSSHLKFKAARRRRKRQNQRTPVGAGQATMSGRTDRGKSDVGEDELQRGAGEGRTATKFFLQLGNNKHRNIYSSADNDKGAFLRNYELNINSAALRRMNRIKGRQQGSHRLAGPPMEGESGRAEGRVVDEEDVDIDDGVMLNDDDNAGVLNAVAAVQNGDMVDKNRDDNWMDESDEYYPSRDHFSDLQNLHMPFWDSYDSINQLYLEIGPKTEIKNHYRGHKLSMWLNLIPQLHASGDPELPMRHHHFAEESAQFYDGNVRLQSLTRPPNQEITIIQPPTTMMPQNARPQKTAPVPNLQTTDCPINLTVVMPTGAPSDHHHQASGPGIGEPQLGGPPFDNMAGGVGDAATTASKKSTNILYYSHHHNNGTTQAGTATGVNPPQNVNNNNSPANFDSSSFNLLRRFANSQFQSYTTALTVTVVVGCFLLLLNVLIFVGIYYQREKRVKEARRKDELVELDCQQYGMPMGGPSSGVALNGSGGMGTGRSPSQGSEKNCHKIMGGPGASGNGTFGDGTLNRKGSIHSVRNFGNFNEYRCYDEKNFQQQALGHHHQHFGGSRHHLHHHHSHGSLNRKYLVDVCHNGSVVDLPHGMYGECSQAVPTTMNRELSASSSHIEHSHQNGGCGGGGGGGGMGPALSGSNTTLLHQSQQQLQASSSSAAGGHHHHHHVCQSRRHSMVTEGTQSDPISLKELEYETNRGTLTRTPKKGGCESSDCRGAGTNDAATGTRDEATGTGDGPADDEDEEDGEEEDEDEEEEEEDGDDESPDIPDPPPPPRSILTGGILRTTGSGGGSGGVDSMTSQHQSAHANTGNANNHPGNSTPSATKKRVQIQEISV